MARTYNVKGTNDFMIWAVLLFALCIWAVRDGWFPPPSKLDKYPQRVAVHFEIEGRVSNILVGEDMEIASGDVLARLDAAEAERALAVAEAELAALAVSESEERDRLIPLRRALEAAQLQLVRHTLRAPEKGVILEINMATNDWVTPDDEAFALDPRHHFYPFNKSLAVFSLIGSLVCLVIHVKVR